MVLKDGIKIHSQTEPADNLFNYPTWYLKTKHGINLIEWLEWRVHGKGFVARLATIDNRNQAEALCPVDIAIDKDALEELEEGEFYWHQLEGLRVTSEFEGAIYDFGRVKKILPTGANDVLVVVADEHSMDQKERLIPYVPNQFIKNIHLSEGRMTVDWDPYF